MGKETVVHEELAGCMAEILDVMEIAVPDKEQFKIVRSRVLKTLNKASRNITLEVCCLGNNTNGQFSEVHTEVLRELKSLLSAPLKDSWLVCEVFAGLIAEAIVSIDPNREISDCERDVSNASEIRDEWEMIMRSVRKQEVTDVNS